MEEDILQLRPSYRLYTRASIVAATLLSGPLAGGYMVAENFNNLNQPKNVRITWLVTIAALLLILGIAFSFEHLPNYVLPILYTLATSRLITHLQQQQIIAHQKENGEIYSAWRVLLIGIIGLILTLAPIFIIAYVMDTFLT